MLKYVDMMEKWIREFSSQLKEAVEIGEKAKLTATEKTFSNVLICGMGGSGIGGNIVAELVSPYANVPISINKNYSIPEYIGENTLVIISSYSGNTEETLSALDGAMEKKAKIVCIASGGKVIETAQKNNLDYILVPTGYFPRAAVGYSMTQIFFILGFYKIIDSTKLDFKKDILASVDLINSEQENMKTLARKVSLLIFKKIPIIYTTNPFEAVALRLKQDLNENSKALAFHSVIPEMNHNEILGWSEENHELVALFIRNPDEYSRTKKRVELMNDLISKKAGAIMEIEAKGASSIERALYLIHMSGWISFFLAELKEISPDEMKAIEDLKVELSKF